MKRIHILRAGRVRDHRGNDVVIDDAMLRDVVGSYNPRHHRAPLVLGHPADDASTPAHGWVAALESGSDGVHAVPEQVGSELADWVKTGRYGPVSASLYGPDHPGNPTPGKWHLRHVGFLGATPPAVKGLQPIEMAALAGGAPDLTVEVALADESPAPWGELARTLRRIREWIIQRGGVREADEVVPEGAIRSALDHGAKPLAEAGLAEPPRHSQAPPNTEHDMSGDNPNTETALAEARAENDRLRREIEAEAAARERAEADAVALELAGYRRPSGPALRR